MNEKNDNSRTGFESLPLAAEASDALRYKVESLRAHPDKPASKMKWFGAFALSGAAAVAIIAVLIASPSQSVAARIMAVKNAVEDLSSMHLLVKSREAGGKEVEVVFTDEGELMVDADDTKVYVLKGGIQIYDAAANTVSTIPISINLTGLMDVMKEKFMPEFSVDGLLKKMEEEAGAENVKVSQPYRLDGRMVFDVLLTLDGRHDRFNRATMTVDQASNLPISVIEEKLEDGNWVENTVVSIRYNDDVTELLKPNFPKDAKRQAMPDFGDIGGEIQREITRELGRNVGKGLRIQTH